MRIQTEQVTISSIFIPPENSSSVPVKFYLIHLHFVHTKLLFVFSEIIQHVSIASRVKKLNPNPGLIVQCLRLPSLAQNALALDADEVPGSFSRLHRVKSLCVGTVSKAPRHFRMA